MLSKDPSKLSTREEFEARIRELQTKTDTLKHFLVSPDWPKHNRALRKAVALLERLVQHGADEAKKSVDF